MTQSMSLKLICSCIVAAVFVIGAASALLQSTNRRLINNFSKTVHPTQTNHQQTNHQQATKINTL